jgi:tetratricopeptide (TPR) repeat protein
MTFLQHHRTRHLQMKVRFSRWEDILAAPAPAGDLPHAAAMWQYARGRALAARGDEAQARAALQRLRTAAADPKLAEQRLEFNTSGAILAIATEVLSGHLAAATKNFDAAVERLRAAANLEDALTYGEPPDWSVPVRQELGMVLLRAGRPAEAEQAFREDLKRFPRNGWSLRGLELALRAQNRIAAAEAVKKEFDEAWATADVEPPDSTPPLPSQ